MRPIALGRKNHLFAGSDDGGKYWAIHASLIETALCRSRHRAVYAARRTMPSWVVFPRFLADRRLIGSA
jgi:transposase